MADFVFYCFETPAASDAAESNYRFRSHADTAAASDDLHVQWHGYAYEIAEKTITRMRTVLASLTHEARWHMARAAYMGSRLTPCFFTLGTGWNEPRWNTLPDPSGASTQIIAPVFHGSAAAGQITMEEANASTLVLRLSTYDAFASQVNEVLIYARINNDSTYKGRVIPFASCRWPTWYHAPASGSYAKQRFVARVIIPLGTGARVTENTAFNQRYLDDSVSVADSVVKNVDYVLSCAEDLTTTETTAAVS